MKEKSFKVIESLSGYALVNDEKPEQRKPEDMRLVCGSALVARGPPVGMEFQKIGV